MWTFINIHLIVNFEMHHYAENMSRVLHMKDSRLADHRATSFLSNKVGSEIKLNVEDVNSDKMIDSQLTARCDRAHC